MKEYTATVSIDVEVQLSAKNLESVNKILDDVEAIVNFLGIEEGENGVESISISCEETMLNWQIVED